MFLWISLLCFFSKTTNIIYLHDIIHKLLALQRSLRGFEIIFKMQHLKEELHLYLNPCIALWSELMRRGSQCCFREATVRRTEYCFSEWHVVGLEFSRNQLQWETLDGVGSKQGSSHSRWPKVNKVSQSLVLQMRFFLKKRKVQCV